MWWSLIIIMDKVSVCRLSQRVIVPSWTYHFVRAEKFFWTIKAFAKIIVGRLESDMCFFFRFCCLPLTSFLQLGVYRVKTSRSRKPLRHSEQHCHFFHNVAIWHSDWCSQTRGEQVFICVFVEKKIQTYNSTETVQNNLFRYLKISLRDRECIAIS